MCSLLARAPSFGQAVLECFGKVMVCDRQVATEVRDRPRDLQHAVKAARGKAQTLGGALEEDAAAFVDGAEPIEGAPVQVGIQTPSTPRPRQLTLARSEHARSHDRGRLAQGFASQIGDRDRLHVDDEIDPVEQRA